MGVKCPTVLLCLAALLMGVPLIASCSPPIDSTVMPSVTQETESVLARHEIAVAKCSPLVRRQHPRSEDVTLANWADDGLHPDPSGATQGYWVYTVEVTTSTSQAEHEVLCKLTKLADGQYEAELLA